MTAFLAGPGLASDRPEPGPDVPWRSDDPHLSGNFLPVLRETTAEDLPVVSGRIPADLRGAYLRNGPNPMFKPIGFTYPLDGDGMIHAVHLDGGRARYRNRFVRTKGLAVEQRVGHAVYGGFAHPVPPDPKDLQAGDSHVPFKNGAFVNVISHGGRLIALNEATSGYEMNPALETLGEWTAGTDQPIRLGAHNRRHPRTGDLFALEYSWREPVLRVHRIDASGTLVQSIPVATAMPTMIHDFVLTERYIVLVVGPAVFDRAAAKAGQSMLQWRPDLGMRIALIPLDGSAVRWIEGDAFFAYHFANAFDRGNQVIVDYVHHGAFGLGSDADTSSTFHRMTIDLTRGSFVTAPLADMTVEFPRVNHRFEALPTRYAYMPTRSSTLTLPDPPAATFNTLVRFDTATGTDARHDFGNRIIGEGAFVPRPGADGEDDGYIALFVYDPARNGSTFELLNARDVAAEPVVVLQLPQRVPQGLHGNWIDGI
ncbi:MAG: carotenoid oxygenase family protein [Burkholderiales bacterium]|nr:carotenoid oxygenase family protein [Burkholderiales bacterium]